LHFRIYRETLSRFRAPLRIIAHFKHKNWNETRTQFMAGIGNAQQYIFIAALYNQNKTKNYSINLP
jgi:hypothetical protein